MMRRKYRNKLVPCEGLKLGDQEVRDLGIRAYLGWPEFRMQSKQGLVGG